MKNTIQRYNDFALFANLLKKNLVKCGILYGFDRKTAFFIIGGYSLSTLAEDV